MLSDVEVDFFERGRRWHRLFRSKKSTSMRVMEPIERMDGLSSIRWRRCARRTPLGPATTGARSAAHGRGARADAVQRTFHTPTPPSNRARMSGRRRACGEAAQAGGARLLPSHPSFTSPFPSPLRSSFPSFLMPGMRFGSPTIAYSLTSFLSSGVAIIAVGAKKFDST